MCRSARNSAHQGSAKWVETQVDNDETALICQVCSQTSPPYKVVVTQLGPLTYLVEVEGGLKWKRHSDHFHDGSGVPQELLTTDLDDEILDDTYPS